MTTHRKERIEWLLCELKYEITRGVMEHEIDEQMGFTFVIPCSHRFPNGVVWGQFYLHPVEHVRLTDRPDESPRLRIVHR